PPLDDLDAFALAPVKPKPHSRSGAIALLEPVEAEPADGMSEVRLTLGAIQGNPLIERIKFAFGEAEYPAMMRFHAAVAASRKSPRHFVISDTDAGRTSK